MELSALLPRTDFETKWAVLSLSLPSIGLYSLILLTLVFILFYYVVPFLVENTWKSLLILPGLFSIALTLTVELAAL